MMGKERRAFWMWLPAGTHDANDMPDLFIEWLLTTGDGAVVLERINTVPRQLFLPFQDDEQPWVTHDQ